MNKHGKLELGGEKTSFSRECRGGIVENRSELGVRPRARNGQSV